MAEGKRDRKRRTQKLAEQVALKVLAVVGSGIEAALRAPVMSAITAVLVGGGSGAGAHWTTGPIRIALLAITGTVIVASLLVLRRVRRNRLLRALRATTRSQRLTIEANEQVQELQAKQLAEARSQLAVESRRRAYQKHETDVLNGLHLALAENGESLDPVSLIEDNSLIPTAEVFASMLHRPDGRSRVELGIAEAWEHHLQVTHASGEFTHELKRGGDCYTGPHTIEEILARKARVHFVRDGWVALEIGRKDSRRRYLFALTNAPFEDPECESLEAHAAIVKVTHLALTSQSTVQEGGRAHGRA